jgi:hypothetical protein
MELTLFGAALNRRVGVCLIPGRSKVSVPAPGSPAHAKLRRVAGCPGSHRLMAPNLVMQRDRRQIRLDT